MPAPAEITSCQRHANPYKGCSSMCGVVLRHGRSFQFIGPCCARLASCAVFAVRRMRQPCHNWRDGRRSCAWSWSWMRLAWRWICFSEMNFCWVVNSRWRRASRASEGCHVWNTTSSGCSRQWREFRQAAASGQGVPQEAGLALLLMASQLPWGWFWG